MSFDGGSFPYYIIGTKNCTTCCNGGAPTGKAAAPHTLDFDVTSTPSPSSAPMLAGPSADPRAATTRWVNSTGSVLNASTGVVTFSVHGLALKPTRVRYTAASIFPQCALYNNERLPATPFELDVQ